MKHSITILLFSFIMMNSAIAEDYRDGEIREQADTSLQAWDKEKQQWVTPDQFWISFADRSGGLTWGKRADYPEYNKVKERDTLIIELEKGDCMMEFFHSRWRLANAVERWDEKFNDYAGCPYVFDE